MSKRAIPACAGRTASAPAARAWSIGPSPRVRGEPARPPRGAPRFTGHPRVCGENARHLRAVFAAERAIPACAGRTDTLWCPQVFNFGPSPRVRGERRCRTSQRACFAGHPRVCGENRQCLPSGPGVDRAIPACAGRTASAPAARASSIGPSPRVRGERSIHEPPRSSFPGHPRVCGENGHN